MDLEGFIISPMRNAWISEPGLAYYVRKSLMFPGAIELANCSAPHDSNQFGFWRFIRKYRNKYPFVVEQVLNPGIERFLDQLGWTKAYIGPIPQFASPLLVANYSDTKFFQMRFG